MVRRTLILLTLLLSWSSASAQIQSIGIAGDGEFTRITISADHDIAASIALADGPDGYVIKVTPDWYAIGNNTYYGNPTGGITAYTLDTDGIVFELDRPMMVSRELDLPPTGSETRHRLILDLVRVSEARFQRAANRAPDPQPQSPVIAETPDIIEVSVEPETPSVKPTGLRQAILDVADRRRHRIAIDPGHGGRDPGAPIVSGGEEKTIVLKTSLLLQKMLQDDPRYDVLLTRTDDTYVEHEDRVSMAREWGADLFISVHADAALRPNVTGASVYTISTRGERRIEGTADKYGWEIPIETGASQEVEGILTDWVKRETKSNSAIFADFLLPELAKAGPLVRNSHRQGNLFVLLAPDVPAVLVEIGFLSNKADARRLKSKTGRRKSAEAIKRAIDAYFDRQDSLLATN